MYKYLAVLLLVAAVVRGQGSIDDIDPQDLNEIFGTPPTPPATPGAGNPLTPVPTSGTEAPNTQPTDDRPCVTDEGEVGLCVPYYLCVNKTVLTDGTGIIDIRLKGNNCNKDVFEKCCAIGNVKSPTDPEVTQAPPVPETREGCGWRNEHGLQFRITGAMEGESNFAEFPWMVALLTIEPVNEDQPDGQKINVYTGGGSLIHPSVVLTAAHNIYNIWKKKTIRARAGEWDTQTKREPFPFQDRQVVDVDMHRDFNKGNLFYDVAVLFLDTPFDVSAPNVRLVCLPPPRETAPAGTRCLVSGWGKDNYEKEGRYQTILKKIEVPVVAHNTCQVQLRRTRLGPLFELHTSFMCAGGEKDKDACKGDGGSPLVCPVEFEQGRYVQRGIVAWGIGCGQDGTPGVYVDVANLRDWIDNAVRGKGHDSRMYSVY